jgi:hypothetical protein
LYWAALTVERGGQTWPRALNAEIGGSADDIFLIVADVHLRFLCTISID